MQVTASEIAARAGGEVLAGDPNAIVSSWAFDSRALAPGACFVALTGHRDGHDFVVHAFHSGASVALVSRPLAAPVAGTLVRVDDTLAALQSAARAVRRDRPGLRVVGVAGSTGKTSTKDVLAAVLAPLSVYANPESYNNEFGLPVTLLNAPSFAEVVVTEMGERFAGDIAALCDIARPDIGVITNVGLAHAEHLGGREGAAQVLAELVEALPANGLAVLGADEWAPVLTARSAAPVLTVGTADDADVRISDISVGADLRPSFVIARQRFEVPLRGEHQVLNAAMAATVAHHGFDIPWVDVAALMRDARGSRWRMEVVERADDVVVLNDAYNANPDSMEAALRALAHIPGRSRRIAVLGDMRELGDHAAAAHAAVGECAADLQIDIVVGVGAGGATIAEAAGRGGVAVQTAADAPAALAIATALVQPGDAVLVKASRALALQRVAEELIAEAARP